MVKTPPPTGLTALARAAARSSGSKATATTATSCSSHSSNRFHNSEWDSDNDCRFDNDDNDIKEVEPPPLAEATLADVEIIKMMDDEPMEPLKLIQKIVKGQPTHLTKIKSIAGNIITGIIVGDLQTFAANNKVVNAQSSRDL